jgi:hypothetical protein
MELDKILSAIMVFSILVSCSGSDGSGGSAGGESIYDPGASVPARGTAFMPHRAAHQRRLGVRAVHDGMYVQPGTRRLAVRVEGDQATIDRVSSATAVSTRWRRSGRATCSLRFRHQGLPVVQRGACPGHPHRWPGLEGKVVFRTTTEGMDEQLILDGIGMMVSQDLLKFP